MLIRAKEVKISTMNIAGISGYHHHPLKKAPWERITSVGPIQASKTKINTII